MSKKIKEIKDVLGEPITWGDYLKLCIVCLIISCAYCVVYGYAFIDGFRDSVNKFFRKLMFWKKNEEESFDDEL